MIHSYWFLIDVDVEGILQRPGCAIAYWGVRWINWQLAGWPPRASRPTLLGALEKLGNRARPSASAIGSMRCALTSVTTTRLTSNPLVAYNKAMELMAQRYPET